MKTTITIEDGRIEVQVDDGRPIVVEPVEMAEVVVVDEPPALPEPPAPAVIAADLPTAEKICRKCGDKYAATGKSLLSKYCGDCRDGGKAADVDLNEARRELHHRGDCIYCGDAIMRKTLVGRGPKVCGKKECKKRYSREYMDRRRKGETKQSNATDGETPWCVHCQAFTNHQTPDHPDDMPSKYKPRIGDYKVKPKPPESLDPIVYYDRNKIFLDPWQCLPCRDYEQPCNLHKALEKEGKRPPGYKVPTSEPETESKLGKDLLLGKTIVIE